MIIIGIFIQESQSRNCYTFFLLEVKPNLIYERQKAAKPTEPTQTYEKTKKNIREREKKRKIMETTPETLAACISEMA